MIVYLQSERSDLELLRRALHEAVDRIFEAHVGAAREAATDSDNEVMGPDENGPLEYRWPNGLVESFSESRSYTLVAEPHAPRALVAWTVRDAWGRPRPRAVVFGKSGSHLYPWTEFVETDDLRLAAPIPDPVRPRAMLAHGATIPGRLASATVDRTDRLFKGVKSGPALRVVLTRDAEADMVRHGYWVAGLRKRLRS